LDSATFWFPGALVYPMIKKLRTLSEPAWYPARHLSTRFSIILTA
jgi:hypothetical protein